MSTPSLLIAGLLCAAALGYVLFVNRRYQRYSGRFVLDIPVEEAWDLLSTRPGVPGRWVPGLISTEASNEGGRDFVSLFENGQECFIRLIAQEAPAREECVSVSRSNPAAPFGDAILCRIVLRPVAEGTEADLTYVIERRHLATGFLSRLSYPLLVSQVASLLRGHLARERQGRDRPARSRRSGGRQLTPEPLVQLGLAVLSLAAFSSMLGWETGLAMVVTIAVHEYGHVFSLRRHGHDARFYLIPYLGGVAIGSRPYLSDAEACEVILMGPAFGLLPPLVCLALFSALGDSLWIEVGLVTLLVNLFNLLPIPPLDGGHAVQVFLKLFGDAVWFGVSGLLILMGGALAYVMRSPDFLVILIFAAVAWSAAPRRPYGEDPLTMTQGVTAVGAYVTLIALHVAAVFWCNNIYGGRLLETLF